MLSDIRHNPLDYLLLLIIIGSGVVFFSIFSFDKNVRVAIVLITSLAYFVWGLFHHWKNNDLDLKIVLEYLLLSLLAVIFYGVVST